MAASKSPQLRLFHIRDEIDGVTAAVRSISFDEYCGSFMLRRAAERAVQIISEAAKALPSELTARYPDAPWAAIIGIGNVLRHEYQSVGWAKARSAVPTGGLTIILAGIEFLEKWWARFALPTLRSLRSCGLHTTFSEGEFPREDAASTHTPTSPPQRSARGS